VQNGNFMKQYFAYLIFFSLPRDAKIQSNKMIKKQKSEIGSIIYGGFGLKAFA